MPAEPPTTEEQAPVVRVGHNWDQVALAGMEDERLGFRHETGVESVRTILMDGVAAMVPFGPSDVVTRLDSTSALAWLGALQMKLHLVENPGVPSDSDEALKHYCNVRPGTNEAAK